VRTAYVVSPERRGAPARGRTAAPTTVMASPWTNALVTRWLELGLGERVLMALREECFARAALVREHLGPAGVRTQPYGFHAWLPVPDCEEGCTGVAARLQQLGRAWAERSRATTASARCRRCRT
jgi:DNA-binding transcriptional MocR family regulator